MRKRKPIVVMGVAGSGKTTYARTLALQLGRPFVEADIYHSEANKLKMRDGGLSDEDRWPWLDAVAVAVNELEGPVVACSLLKARYRTYFRKRIGRFRLVFLQISEVAARRRLEERTGHFAGPELLDSQFRDLEPPRRAKRIAELG